jgi:hypothetical protein
MMSSHASAYMIAHPETVVKFNTNMVKFSERGKVAHMHTVVKNKCHLFLFRSCAFFLPCRQKERERKRLGKIRKRKKEDFHDSIAIPPHQPFYYRKQ